MSKNKENLPHKTNCHLVNAIRSSDITGNSFPEKWHLNDGLDECIQDDLLEHLRPVSRKQDGYPKESNRQHIEAFATPYSLPRQAHGND